MPASIQNFVSSMSKAKGFARLAQYEVVISLPEQLWYANNLYSRQLSLHCNSISMPGHDLQTESRQYGSEPARDLVVSHAYEGNIMSSFYLSSDLVERDLMLFWQELAVNTVTNKANYYDSYIGTMEIYQLSSRTTESGPRNSRTKTETERVSGIKVREVYPTTVGGLEYAYASKDSIATLAVGFAFKDWQALPASKLG